MRAGLFLGALVAFAVRASGEDYHPDREPALELYDVYEDDTVDEAAAELVGDAKAAWRRALDRAAGLSPESVRYGLAEVRRLDQLEPAARPPKAGAPAAA